MQKINRLFALAIFAIATLCLFSSDVYADDAASGKDAAVLDLGKIHVLGQTQIVKALQEIKVALNRPESADPKLADAVVCRINRDIGSYADESLTCATNRALQKRRDATQTARLNGLGQPNSGIEQMVGFNSPLGLAVNAT